MKTFPSWGKVKFQQENTCKALVEEAGRSEHKINNNYYYLR